MTDGIKDGGERVRQMAFNNLAGGLFVMAADFETAMLKSRFPAPDFRHDSEYSREANARVDRNIRRWSGLIAWAKRTEPMLSERNKAQEGR